MLCGVFYNRTVDGRADDVLFGNNKNLILFLFPPRLVVSFVRAFVRAALRVSDFLLCDFLGRDRGGRPEVRGGVEVEVVVEVIMEAAVAQVDLDLHHLL